MSTVPVTFNFEEGLILRTGEEERVEEGEDDPPNTLSLNNGDSEPNTTTSKSLSHLRLSPGFDDLPRNSSLNASPSDTFVSEPAVDEALTLIATWDDGEE